jgi:hypothetical protein
MDKLTNYFGRQDCFRRSCQIVDNIENVENSCKPYTFRIRFSTLKIPLSEGVLCG